MRKKICAVYAIEHVESGRRYIGGSVSYKLRWQYHRNKLRKGTHENGPLQKAWSTCGPDAFRFFVLEVVPDSWDLRAVEQRHIDRQGRTSAGMFNLYTDATSSKGYKHPPSFGEAVSARNRGSKRTPETRRRMSERMKGNQHGAGSSYCGVLRAEQIRPIFDEVASGKTTTAAGVVFGVSGPTIARVIRRATWTTVEVPSEIVERAQRLVAANRGTARRRDAKLRDRIGEVRARIAAGEPSSSIAADCGVTPAAINSIKAGRVWRE